ncbi:hypothetical protein OIDMADRAFT_21053 [Oidiodendron maius Zn]|uniref:ABM domain-containing protein n=1 Tax=Oidiodendron maius (strain Zn) TaxID=913774 RepID=A0A0C3CA12_OIDMZ|nr:hypothetical protein OIDMADRAFT_21053 [Oidiodendron maius Zn]
MSSHEINVIAILTPLEGKFDAVVEAFTDLSQQVHANEPGTLIYYAVRPEGKSELVVVERYKNAEAAKVHRESQNLQVFFEKTRPLLEIAPEIKRSSYVTGFERVEG